ncbi:hypothetical protein ABZT51_42750 [Streptomyces sp. NPDC005373]|uniref:hypothetical protein n=1 Tax=Streptomyces sp. NPDC005373 TaxID=3156879 RepID=UPI0033A2F25E
MSAKAHHATVEDVHPLAAGMPHVTLQHGPRGNNMYQVGGKSFVFFRPPAGRGRSRDRQPYPDVITFWAPPEVDEQALLQDPSLPFFTTSHSDGRPPVRGLCASHIDELTGQQLTQTVQDAWPAQASNRMRTAWLADHGLPLT